MDPLGFGAGDVNVYRYCSDFPTSLCDSFGLCANNEKDGKKDPLVAMCPRTGGRLSGDDPGADIRDLQKRLQDPDVSAREKSQIRRRIKELTRRPSKRAHGADKFVTKMVGFGKMVVGGGLVVVSAGISSAIVIDDVTGVLAVDNALLPFSLAVGVTGSYLASEGLREVFAP
jgi:hypothetical protein